MPRSTAMPRTTAGTRSIASSRQTVRDFGSSLFFDGINDNLSWGNILTAQTVVTAAFWFYLTKNGSSNYDVLFGYGNTRWFFILNGNGGSRAKMAFSVKSGSVEKSSGYLTNNLTLNQWYLAVGTYDPNGGSNNTTLRVYSRHGGLVEAKLATQTGGIDSTAQPLVAGKDPNRGFHANMLGDDFRVYSRVLTVDEQDRLAIGIEPSATNLELLARVDEGSGTSALDESGNNRTGTITDAVYSSNVVTQVRTIAS